MVKPGTIWFTLILALPLALTLTGFQPGKILDENKQKARAPRLVMHCNDLVSWTSKAKCTYTSAVNFKNDLERYLRDNLVFRAEAFEFFKVLKTKLGSQVIPNKLIEANDSWLFMGNDFNNVLLKSKALINLSESELDFAQNEIEKRLQYCKRKNISYYLAIAPDKHSYYGDKINIVQNSLKKKAIEQLKSLNMEVPLIDLGEGFHNLNEEFYHREDSHWNSIGAFSAYNTLMTHIARDYEDITILRKEDLIYRESENIKSDLSDMLQEDKPIKQMSWQVENKGARRLEVKSTWIPAYFRNYPFLYEMKYQHDQRNYKILFFRDSFFDALLPYVIESFNESILVWDYRFRKEMIDKYNPDIVVDLIVERNINKLTDAKMSIDN